MTGEQEKNVELLLMLRSQLSSSGEAQNENSRVTKIHQAALEQGGLPPPPPPSPKTQRFINHTILISLHFSTKMTCRRRKPTLGTYFFAHCGITKEELIPNLLRTDCRQFLVMGTCMFGSKCKFNHCTATAAQAKDIMEN